MHENKMHNNNNNIKERYASDRKVSKPIKSVTLKQILKEITGKKRKAMRGQKFLQQ